MEIEQDTPVLSSSIDYNLLSDIDLPDLRLHRAFKVWDEFKTIHQQQITETAILS